MAFTLMTLPYAKDALAPHLTAETFDYHHGKHHQAYVTNLNKFVEDGKADGSKSLVELVKTTEGPVFNNAAQVYNHDFFWQSMKPKGGGAPTGKIADQITKDFGSFDAFKTEFTAAATTQFGSGWAWLVLDADKLKVVKTANAECPLTKGQKPILTLDVWEHAYYIDYRNARPKWIETYLTHLVNWDFANANLG